MPHNLHGLQHFKVDSYLQPPSVLLPPLRLLATQTPAAIVGALTALRELYWPAWFADEDAVACNSRSRRPDLPVAELHAALPLLDTPSRADKLGTPDSGYASAEEDAEDVREVAADDRVREAAAEEEEEEEERIEVLRADPLERAYAVRWLTGLIARGEEWGAGSTECALAIDEAAALLARCADTHADGALARRFVFGGVAVELWDEPYADDPAGVGLQTWGSACVLAARLCADPSAFGLEGRVRVLELGAGTGLLSLAVAARCALAEVVATDFHPGVLANLRGNVVRNAAARAVRVEALDWEHSRAVDETERYDVILAADVIYDARHGGWIKRCAEGLLRRGTGTMWMIVPRRPTRGREVAEVEDVFAEGTEGLKILHVEDVERCRGVGRADEPGYKLFRIGW